MPKAILEFDLDDVFERENFKYAHTGLHVRLAVGSFDQELRVIFKQWDENNEPTITIHEARGMLWKHFEEHEVDWEVI